MYTVAAMQVLIFLLPGFVSAMILGALVVRRERAELRTVVEALAFSVLIYTCYSLVSNTSPVVLKEVDDVTSISFKGTEFLWLTLFSVTIPLALSLIMNNDLHMKLARMLHLTKRTSRISVWFDAFYTYKRFVIINFEGGRRIRGWPMFYSDDPNNPYVFLWQPAWIVVNEKTQETEVIELDEEGILITPQQKIETIEFLRQT